MTYNLCETYKYYYKGIITFGFDGV